MFYKVTDKEAFEHMKKRDELAAKRIEFEKNRNWSEARGIIISEEIEHEYMSMALERSIRNGQAKKVRKNNQKLRKIMGYMLCRDANYNFENVNNKTKPFILVRITRNR